MEAVKDKGADLFRFMQKRLGDGVDTCFWKDTWNGELPFKLTYPRLYALEVDKNISVADKLTHATLAGTFMREPRSGIEAVQLTKLEDQREDVQLVNKRDSGLDFTEVSSYDEWLLWISSLRIHGSKVRGCMSHIQNWNDVVENMSSRLSKWKMKTLSIGGRLTFIKAVLEAMPIYYMSIFKAPLGVLKMMESIRCRKIGTRTKSGYNSLWRDIVFEMEDVKDKGADLFSFMQKRLGDGVDTCFWKDTWNGDLPFKLTYPRLYAVEVDKNISVADKLAQATLAGTFRREPRSSIEALAKLEDQLEDVQLVNKRDMWAWSLNGSGEFSVASIRRLLDDIRLPEVSSQTMWIKAVPIKVNILAWKRLFDDVVLRTFYWIRYRYFRPISLIGCTYKIIAKLLAFRPAKVIHKIVSPNQTAFIKGRQILNGVLVANEVIDYALNSGTNRHFFKVDFAKAFDSVRWEFLLDTMKQMGFSAKWISWISGCLQSASISVLVNGSPTSEFHMERGLRQGDPLSPLLFNIVSKALQITILEACDKGVFKGVSLNDGETNLPLLQYADDALLFCDWSLSNIRNSIRILKCFHSALGLGVDLSKSCIYGEVEMFARITSCKAGSLPFIYLGLPVGKSMSRFDDWDEVINRVNSRLSSWKSRLLSIGGRLTLAMSVLGALSLYYLSLFRAPVKVINELEKIRCRFFWGFKDDQKGVVWISWKNTIASRDLGGLGLGSFRAKNLGLLAKWQWRFLNENDAVWNKVISSLYGPHGGFNLVGSRLRNGVWQNILNVGGAVDALGISYRHSFKRKVGSGYEISNWTDNWSDDGPCFKEKFPRLYALESNKNCFLQDRSWFLIVEWRPNWEWQIQPRGRAEGDMIDFENLLNGLALELDVSDGWIWSLNHNKGFSVKSIWFKCFDWWNFSISAHPPSFVSLVSLFVSRNNKWLVKICHGISLVVLWSIWRWRNRVVHTISDSRQTVIDEDIFPQI
nr:RNA-directed DNA polymerase, eukaryota [Tanacetum cinerariifolium]